MLNKDPSVTNFLLSFLRQNSRAANLPVVDLQQIKPLKSHVFLLVHRALTDCDPTPVPLLEVSFLEDLSFAYGRNASLRELLVQTWTTKDLGDFSPSFRKKKSTLIKNLESGIQTLELEDSIQRTASLLRILYQYGQYLMEGSDFVDSLAISYGLKDPDFQKKIVVTAYLCLASLLETDRPKISTLIDHLYSLMNTSGHDNLLRSICSSTPFLRKLRAKISGPEAARAKSLLQQLSAFETTASGKPRRLIKRKINKGKSRAVQENGHGALSDVHAHKLSLVTQIQDLFPDLGSGFIVKLLSEYNDDTEQVIAHLLDDSLPDHLTQADRTEELSVSLRLGIIQTLTKGLGHYILTSSPWTSCQIWSLIQRLLSLLGPKTLSSKAGEQCSTTTPSQSLPSHLLNFITADLPTHLRQPMTFSPLHPRNRTRPQSFPHLLHLIPMMTNVTIHTTSKMLVVRLTLLSQELAMMCWTPRV